MKKENYLELKEIVDSGFWNIDLVTGVVTGKRVVKAQLAIMVIGFMEKAGRCGNPTIL
ncbi:hypothetical protein G3M54_01400 [Bacillus megaterium NBRC 15308 = ATCC 14581]|nr:hypothetical protein [Priestia megaterium NBRC 15308 = ATCC 14581]